MYSGAKGMGEEKKIEHSAVLFLKLTLQRWKTQSLLSQYH